MKPIVFLGPTLATPIARRELDAVYLPPAAQGDVYQAARQQPVAIGIIDGFFERLPAVWHKEILWAIQNGIRVFGAASMGALRAAELSTFGMEGVGRIFRAFRDGLLEDDDEVAVAHADAEAGYRVASEAMVNVRWTIEAAISQQVISEATGAIVLRAAKDLFYADRTYSAILEAALERGADSAAIAALEPWLVRGRVDQKAIDAREMLGCMRQRLSDSEPPSSITFRMEETIFWHHAMMEVAIDGTAGSVPLDALLDELRLHGQAYVVARHAALIRAAATDMARRRRINLAAADLEASAIRFRRERSLLRAAEFGEWLTTNGLSEPEYRELIAEQTALGWVSAMYSNEVKHFILSELRVRGRYATLLVRAQDKRQRLMKNGLNGIQHIDGRPSRATLLHWHFVECLHKPVPEDVGGYARSLDLPGSLTFEEMLWREWLYQRCQSEAVPVGAHS